MYTPKIRELIRKNFKEDLDEAKNITELNVGFSLIHNDKPFLKYHNDNEEEIDMAIQEQLKYKKSRATKEIGHHMPDTDFVDGIAKPTFSIYTMYINKEKGTAILRDTGWIHYASGIGGYNYWDTFTVYNLKEKNNG